MTDISIIGAGKLGTSLGFALLKKGYRIKALSCKTSSSAKESRQIIGEGTASTDNIQTAKEGRLIFLCLSDEDVIETVKELLSSDINWSKKYVFHCSGLLSSDTLKPLKEKGALTASIHPIQSFSQKRTDPRHFRNIYFGLEGCQEALKLSKKIVQQLGGFPLILQGKDKVLYHVACSIASNFLVVLLDMATSLIKQIGFQEEQALQIILPLVKGTLHNVKKFNIKASLTGPTIRGDKKSVQKHLNTLKNFPSYSEAYKKLTALALEMAKREKKLSAEKIKDLESLLEGK